MENRAPPGKSSTPIAKAGYGHVALSPFFTNKFISFFNKYGILMKPGTLTEVLSIPSDSNYHQRGFTLIRLIHLKCKL